MKTTQITEDTYENISIIEDIVDYILSTMPDTIPENSTYKYGYFARGGNSGNDWLQKPPSAEIKSIKELIEENKNNPKIKESLDRLIFNQINFHNTEEYLKHNAYGDYSWGPINIYVSRMQNSTRTFVINSNEDYGYPSMAHSKMVRTLFHEIRHFFQDTQYSSYLRKADRDLNKKTGETRPWGERQIEWDAKWSDTLYDINVEGFSSATDYAGVVMEEFKRWVNLSPKVEQHYYRKTISYYLNWVRKQLEKQWQKIVKASDQYITNGMYTRQDLVDYVLEDLTWYTNNSTGIIPPAVKQYFKMKTIKYYEEKTKPLKTKNKLNQYIEKYKQEYSEILQNFLDANQRRIADINTYGAASGIVNKLMDNNPDFFYTKNKAMYEISHEINKHYYKQTVDYIKWLKEIQTK
jgi:hypothetical protein